MRTDPWRSAAVVPVFLYAVAAALWVFAGVTPVLVVAFFLTALALPMAAWVGRRLLPFAPGAILAAGTGLLWLVNGAPPTGVLADVGAGVLLASPLTFLAAVWVTEDLPGTSVAMIIIGLTDSVGLLAATRNLTTLPGQNGSEALLSTAGAVYTQQGAALVALLRGQVPTNTPMAQTPDAIFVLLGILAMVGLLLSLLRGPGEEWLRTGTGPVAPRHPAGSAVPRPAPSPELAGILASATRPEMPAFPAYSGLLPVLAAAGAASGFLALAEFRPVNALIGVAIGVAVCVAYLIATSVRSSGRSGKAPADAAGTARPPNPR